MNTPNLDNLKNVRNPSPLQYAILLYGDEQSASLEDLLDAERAAAEFAAMQARIEKLETASSKAMEWLNHYPSPDNKEEQAESNRRRALNILEKALTK
jgi:formate dehydrogenase maturation protein FdhE